MSLVMLIFGDFTHPPSAYVFVFSDYSLQLLNCYDDPDFKGKFLESLKPSRHKECKIEKNSDRQFFCSKMSLPQTYFIDNAAYFFLPCAALFTKEDKGQC